MSKIQKTQTIEETFEEVYRKEEAKKLILKIGNNEIRIFISDFIIIIASILFFISGFLPRLSYVGFAFSIGLLMTLVIRLNIIKVTAMFLLIISYFVILFSSFYISSYDVFLLVIGINNIGKFYTYIGSAIIIGIYAIGLIGGVKGFRDKPLIIASFIILGLSIGSAIMELAGNLIIYQIYDPLVLTSEFILEMTGFFVACLISFSMAFLLIYSIKQTWIKISER